MKKTVKKVRKYQNSGPALRASSDNTRLPKRRPAEEARAKTNKAISNFATSGAYNKQASDEWFNANRDHVIRKGWDDMAERLWKRSNEYDAKSKEDFRKADSARASLKQIPKDKKGGKVKKAKTGTLVPKKSSVSKRVGSAKKSIGNRSMKRK